MPQKKYFPQLQAILFSLLLYIPKTEPTDSLLRGTYLLNNIQTTKMKEQSTALERSIKLSATCPYFV